MWIGRATTFEPAGLGKSVGVMSMRFFKDAPRSRWDNDPETKEYKEFQKNTYRMKTSTTAARCTAT